MDSQNNGSISNAAGEQSNARLQSGVFGGPLGLSVADMGNDDIQRARQQMQAQHGRIADAARQLYEAREAEREKEALRTSALGYAVAVCGHSGDAQSVLTAASQFLASLRGATEERPH
jgi:hypothetical protein